MPTPVPRLQLLGTPQLKRGDAAYPLPDSVPGYLVAFLAHRADWVAREQLATLCWPDSGEEDAQHNLRVNLTRLRPLLRTWGLEAALLAERRRLRLDLETDTAAQRAAMAAGAWNEAAAIAHGDFLQGVTFRAFPVLGEWARAEREALRVKWREAILAAAPVLEPPAAGTLADRYLECDPFDEEVLRLRLAALIATGRHDDARRAYERFSARSLAELGFGPSAALEAFMQGLMAPPSAGATVAIDDDALIGREDELNAVAGALAHHRLVAIVGLGGAGKTRLAREAARRVSGSFVAGQWWLSATELSDPAQLPRRLADLAGLPGGGGPDPLPRLAERLAGRPALTVLDSAEQLLGDRAALLATLQALLDASPSLRVLVTSREPLGLAVEHVQRLEGLAIPTGKSDALEAAAVRLFIAHARRARPGFDPRSAPAELADIARLTGGLPLALRLAASWMRLIGCAQVAQELRRGLAALDLGGGGSVRAALSGSWNRLASEEQAALAALSMFAGEFDLDAARRVADAGLPLLARLFERSLLQRSAADAQPVFDLHPLVRQFAREALERDPAAARAARERHAVLFAGRLGALHDAGANAPKDALARIGRMLGDAVAAWQWAAAAARSDLLLQIVPPLGRFYEAKGRLDDGIEQCVASEALLDPQDRQELAALAVLTRLRGTLLYRKSDYDAAEAVLGEALLAARAIGHRVGIEACLNVLGLALWMQGRYAQARERVEEARALAAEAGDRDSDAKLSATLALINKAQGDFAGAEAGWQRSLELNRVLGAWERVANALNNLGNLRRGQKRLEEAQGLLEEGLRLCDEHGFVAVRSFLLINLALVHLDAERAAQARSFADLALASAERADERTIVAACRLVLGVLALGAGDLAGAARHYAQALRQTRALGDVQNQLESLDGFGRWLAARGELDRAAAIWCAIARHPKVQAELQVELAGRWAEFGIDAAARARAEKAAEDLDLVVVTEQALAELASFEPEPSSEPGAPAQPMPAA